MFLLFSSQLLGYEILRYSRRTLTVLICSYGIGGLMRGMSTLEFVIEIGIHMPFPGILLYPSKMLYPGVLPLLSMFDALYEGGMAARKKLRVFYIVFAM